jgi:hypothetical protein
MTTSIKFLILFILHIWKNSHKDVYAFFMAYERKPPLFLNALLTGLDINGKTTTTMFYAFCTVYENTFPILRFIDYFNA